MCPQRSFAVCLIQALALWAAPAAPSDARGVADGVFYPFMPTARRDSNNDAYCFGDFNRVAASLDYLTSLGVTGTDAANPATAVNGLDVFIPHADIGPSFSSSATVGIVDSVVKSSGSASNRWPPGLGGGYSNLGIAPDKTAIPGRQYAFVSFHARADSDTRGDVDLGDFGRFQSRFNGLNRPPAAAGCEAADLDTDSEVDSADFGAFQLCFIGPDRLSACG
jgi:hypothetical protein